MIYEYDNLEMMIQSNYFRVSHQKRDNLIHWLDSFKGVVLKDSREFMLNWSQKGYNVQRVNFEVFSEICIECHFPEINDL